MGIGIHTGSTHRKSYLMGVQDFWKAEIHNPGSPHHGKTIGSLGKLVTLKEVAIRPPGPDGETKEGRVRVAVDASLLIYSSALGTVQTDSLTDKDGNSTVHNNTILNKSMQLETAGLEAIWVFDSPEPNELKKLAYARRAEAKAKAVEANKPKSNFKLTSALIDDVKKQLSLSGCTYVQASTGIEAEQYAARLTIGPAHNRFCQYVVSGDSDVLMFGGNMLRMVREKSPSGKTSKTVYYSFEYEEVLKATGLTKEQLTRLGVALGNDFNARIPKCGPASAMRMVKEGKVFMSTEQNTVYRYYLSDIKGQMQPSDFIRSEYNREALIAFFVAKNFNKDRLEKMLPSSINT